MANYINFSEQFLLNLREEIVKKRECNFVVCSVILICNTMFCLKLILPYPNNLCLIGLGLFHSIVMWVGSTSSLPLQCSQVHFGLSKRNLFIFFFSKTSTPKSVFFSSSKNLNFLVHLKPYFAF